MGFIMCFGVFDNFHPGHASYLKQAGEFGDPLIVVVVKDKIVKKEKGRQPQIDEQSRIKVVENKLNELGLMGKVVLGDQNDKWLVVKKYKPRIIYLGYDQKDRETQIINKLKELGIRCKVIRGWPYHPEKYKSSFCIN